MPNEKDALRSECSECDDLAIAWDDPLNPCDCPCHDTAVVGDKDNAREILHWLNHAESAREVPARTTAHKVFGEAHETMSLHSNRPRTVAAAGGATQEGALPMSVQDARCPYCGRKVASNRRPHIVRGFFTSGSDFVGHRSCFMEMSHPEDPRYGHERHDIKEGQ